MEENGSCNQKMLLIKYSEFIYLFSILDIGVLYDGKERVTPDSQIVEFTPNGHSANVNNTHNSAVYLTYKRATEVSPPNEKVVMDLCVIVTTKGVTLRDHSQTMLTIF